MKRFLIVVYFDPYTWKEDTVEASSLFEAMTLFTTMWLQPEPPMSVSFSEVG